MTKKKSLEETLADTRKVFVIPSKATDPTHFLKILYNRFVDLKHLPNSVLNDFIIIICRCGEYIEFDTNVIRMKSAVLAKKLGMTPQTLSTKLTSLQRYNLIKRFTDPETGGFSIIINTNYAYKCSEYRYITLQRKIFDENVVEVMTIKEILDKIKINKNYSILKKKEYADKEGKREIDQLDQQRQMELADKRKEMELLRNKLAKLKSETDEIEM